MATIKAAVRSIEQLKIEFFKYAKPNEKDAAKGLVPVANPYWSLYLGETCTRTPRIGLNWHISDAEKSWLHLESGLLPHEKTGGTFYLTMSDKPKDNAPTVEIPIEFNPYLAAQNAQIAGINGFSTTGAVGDIDKIVAEKLEFALLKEKMKRFESGEAGSNFIRGLNTVLSNPNLGVLIHGLKGLITPVATNGLPQPTQIPPPQYQPPQNQPETNPNAYNYNVEELIYGLDKIRMRCKGVKTEHIIMILGDMIEKADAAQLQMLLGYLGIQFDPSTGNFIIISPNTPPQ